MGRRAEPRKGPGEDAYHHPAPYGARLAGNSIVSQALNTAGSDDLEVNENGTSTDTSGSRGRVSR